MVEVKRSLPNPVIHFSETDEPMNVRRRLGPPPQCHTDVGCPDVFELDDGDLAIIGRDITDELVGRLPADAGVGQGERIVRLSIQRARDAMAAMPQTRGRSRGDVPRASARDVLIALIVRLVRAIRSCACLLSELIAHLRSELREPGFV